MPGGASFNEDMCKKTAEKSNKKLWERAKGVARGKMGGHSARAMQYATKWYKSHGGGYEGKKCGGNSLKKWSDSDWGYAGKKGHSRYLPKSARESLSPGQLRASNRKKEEANRAGKRAAPYSKAVAKKVRTSAK